MTAQPCKARVRAAFAGAAQRYDSVGDVQAQIAARLVEHAHTFRGACVLDAGSGTGYVSHRLLDADPALAICAVDHAHAMCARSALPRTICADIEQLPLTPCVFDAYYSSLAWQWATPQLAAKEALRVLKPGGTLAVATLSTNTFRELKFAFSTIDDHAHVLNFYAAENYCSTLASAGFGNIHLECVPLKVHAPDLHTHLSRIRTLGANQLSAPRRRGLLGRHAWAMVLAAYETLREDQGLPLTYDVIYLFAIKP